MQHATVTVVLLLVALVAVSAYKNGTLGRLGGAISGTYRVAGPLK
jgi:hypothetical protein